MKEDLLIRLSNADAVASKENEVRSIMYEECKECCDVIEYDHLGSIIFRKKSENPDALKIMFTGHMDEVGFMVRHISDIGFLYLIKLGGVIDKTLEMQPVRVTTDDGKKIYGLMNVTKDDKGHVKDIYVDLGAESKEEVAALGVEIGNMVTFDTESHQLNGLDVISGKAMDDRTGCYVVAQALKRLNDEKLDNEIIMSGTSSEEVGVRGAKTATYQVDPDIVFAVDVANNPELVRNFTNHRQIGKGCMLVHYDKTMAPNENLVRFVKETANRIGIPYQCDMLSGGGTDCGNAHLSRSGKLAMVIGIPLRYCHGCVSYAHKTDLDAAIDLVCELARSLTREKYNEWVRFNGGK